jgi:hypothetical protein
MADKKAKANKKIIVRLEGGVVETVIGVPNGYTVEIHDYDVEGWCEGDDPLAVDADGEEHYRTIFEPYDINTRPKR